MRANWKGVLRVAEISCNVALYTAVSTSERIAFHTLNRATGNRVRRAFYDSETGKPVEADDQVKGYETPEGNHILFEPDEIAAAVPENDKVLDIKSFLDCAAFPAIWLERPYYLAPAGPAAGEAFGLIRDGLAATKTVAIARTVLFRRCRSLVIRPEGRGLVATTLHFDYEVQSAAEAFRDMPEVDLPEEMRELAAHIIRSKAGRFNPATFDDRYEAALAKLVQAKIEGRKITPPRPAARDTVVDLMEALRESAKSAPKAKKKAPRRAAPERKAG